LEHFLHLRQRKSIYGGHIEQENNPWGNLEEIPFFSKDINDLPGMEISYKKNDILKKSNYFFFSNIGLQITIKINSLKNAFLVMKKSKKIKTTTDKWNLVTVTEGKKAFLIIKQNSG
jgi:hypothetical protein